MNPMIRVALAVASLTALTGAASAPAQDPAPAPGCAGMSLTDPKDDATRLEGATDGPDNMDVTGLFFNYRNGKTYVTMQLQGGEGSELPPGATGARWYIFFNKGGAEYFVRAGNIVPTGESFEVGHTDTESATGQYVSDGETEGRFGAGFVEMVIPGSLAKTGEALTAARAETFERIGNQLFGVDASNTNGKPYTPAKCEAPGAGEPAPPSTGTPPTTGAPPSTGTPPSGSTDVKPLQIAVPKSAKAKGKALSLKVNSNGQLKGIKATLKKGSKTVGKGSLASLNGKGTLKLKLSRKPKKGSYTLALTGTNPDGRPASLKAKLKLK